MQIDMHGGHYILIIISLVRVKKQYFGLLAYVELQLFQYHIYANRKNRDKLG